MSNVQPFLKELLAAPGLSGYEALASRIIAEKWRPLVHELSRSRLGSLHGLRKGTAAKPRPSLLVAAHMDAIGLMVTGIAEGGFLRLTAIGDVDARVLPGQPVTVHGRENLPGIVVQPPARLLPSENGNNPVPLEHLLVDVGLLPRKVNELIRVGDPISFAQPPLELSSGTLAGHTVDNRASVAALTVCLEELQNRPHTWDVWAVATVQEETGLVGAYSSSYQLRPQIAIVLDTSWAKGPGANDWNTFPLGKGPTIMWGPNIHPALYKAFKELAERLEIPHAVEITPLHTGTDAFATQVTAEGIPSIALGIPIRYMHTPVEVVAVKDIQRAGRLIAEFIAGLQPDFMEKVTWDN